MSSLNHDDIAVKECNGLLIADNKNCVPIQRVLDELKQGKALKELYFSITEDLLKNFECSHIIDKELYFENSQLTNEKSVLALPPDSKCFSTCAYYLFEYEGEKYKHYLKNMNRLYVKAACENIKKHLMCSYFKERYPEIEMPDDLATNIVVFHLDNNESAGALTFMPNTIKEYLRNYEMIQNFYDLLCLRTEKEMIIGKENTMRNYLSEAYLYDICHLSNLLVSIPGVNY